MNVPHKLNILALCQKHTFLLQKMYAPFLYALACSKKVQIQFVW